MTQAQEKSRWFNLRMLIEGVLLGVVYGLFFRFATSFRWFQGGSSVVMTMAFLFLGPMVMGYLTVSRAARAGQVRAWQWIVAPWATVVLTFLGALILYLEGSICVVFALPFALVGASIGGIIGGLVSRSNYKLSSSSTACLAILPLLLAPAEVHFTSPTQTRTVASEIRIHAPETTVWRNIE